MIYLILFAIMIATINFNKELIDNVFLDAKKQKEWHYAQLIQWVVIYGSIAIFPDWRNWLEVLTFGCFYPTLYDIGLNLRRGLKWNHKGVHDLPDWVKIVLIVVGIILIIVKGL
jgi:hypothetical protein